MAETEQVGDRVYSLPVCSLCSSDRIVTTESDSWCEECQKWMSAELIQVGQIPDNPVVRAAIDAAREEATNASQ